MAAMLIGAGGKGNRDGGRSVRSTARAGVLGEVLERVFGGVKMEWEVLFSGVVDNCGSRMGFGREERETESESGRLCQAAAKRRRMLTNTPEQQCLAYAVLTLVARGSN